MSTIKLLKASSYYPSYLRWFYDLNPTLSNAPYDTQYSVLMEDCFAWSDSWKHNLEYTKEWVVQELIVNAEPLQKAWARENKIRYDENYWLRDIFLAQCEVFQPEILFAHAPEISLEYASIIRNRKSPPYIIGYDGIARHDHRMIQNCDLILSCIERSVVEYKSKGQDALYLTYGFDEKVLSKISCTKSKAVEASFIGGLQLRIGHQRRAKLLKILSQENLLSNWISNLPTDKDLIRTFASFIKYGNWNEAIAFPKVALAARSLRGGNLGELYGLAMFEQMAASSITFNAHIQAAGEEAANIRLFEATGVGTCLLTDWKPNLGRFFVPDQEVVTYRSAEEAIEKITFLLQNDDERKAIALRGQARTLAEHTTKKGIATVMSHLNKTLS